MAFQMTIDQQVSVAAEFVDRHGNPAKVDGPPTWITDNSDILALEPAADGLSCLVKSVGMIGKATLQMTADADMGGGVRPVIGTLEIECTAGAAVVVTLTPGAPTDQPTP